MHNNTEQNNFKVEGRDPDKVGVYVSLFSGYRDTTPMGEILLSDFLLQPTYRNQVEEIRQCNNKGRRELKSKLPAATISGVFSRRCDAGLIKHSGFICMDIDSKQNSGIDDWEALKLNIANLPGLYYAGLSVSGKGMYLVFKIASPETHLGHFNALAQDLHERGVIIDTSCSDVSRLRNASYDPNPIYKPDTSAYERIIVHEKPVPQTEYKSTQSNEDFTAYRVGMLIENIERTGKNIAEDYRVWYRIGQALASEFGESGRGFFHAVSSKSRKYNSRRCDYEYDKCLKNCSIITIRTFFDICKEGGITAN